METGVSETDSFLKILGYLKDAFGTSSKKETLRDANEDVDNKVLQLAQAQSLVNLVRTKFISLAPISTQSSSAHVEARDQELWGTFEQDCL